MPVAASTASAPALLEVRGVSKAFPGVVALDDVSLTVRPGTVHALIGENGAGKSTLMKIIAGLCAPDAGELRLAGRSVTLRTPRQALGHGVAMIHQELNLMPALSVAENIWIGREPVNALGLVRHRELNRARARCSSDWAFSSIRRRRSAGCRSPNASSSRSPRRSPTAHASSSWTSRPRR